MVVRCRFRVIEKAEQVHWQKGFSYRIKMSGIKSGPFGDATPSADLNMLIVPEDASSQFKTGCIYLADFHEDPDQTG